MRASWLHSSSSAAQPLRCSSRWAVMEAGIGQARRAGGAIAAAQLQQFEPHRAARCKQQAQRADGDSSPSRAKFGSMPLRRRRWRARCRGWSSSRPWRRASERAQPTWSPCSWVTNTASSSEGCSPRGPRACRTRAAKPQSSRARWTCRRRGPRPPWRCRRCRCRGCRSASARRRPYFRFFEQQADDALAVPRPPRARPAGR